MQDSMRKRKCNLCFPLCMFSLIFTEMFLKYCNGQTSIAKVIIIWLIMDFFIDLFLIFHKGC